MAIKNGQIAVIWELKKYTVVYGTEISKGRPILDKYDIDCDRG